MEHSPSSHVVMFYFIALQNNMKSDSAEKKSESIHSRCGRERTSRCDMLATILLRFTTWEMKAYGTPMRKKRIDARGNEPYHSQMWLHEEFIHMPSTAEQNGLERNITSTLFIQHSNPF